MWNENEMGVQYFRNFLSQKYIFPRVSLINLEIDKESMADL